MTEAIKSWFSRRVEGQMKELASVKHSVARFAVGVVLVFTLIMLYLRAR